ncbi:MAG TPA: histidine kinase dimerization/phospho-acceptor domain-containing protein, partial [Gammaproteobacteria bacterium]|nr:histidine kinase dimerization/phospho-acceptor domain-containing protein [Gammaproteobacteria bacterium]
MPAAPWTPQTVSSPAIRGSWAERPTGFAVELRIPLELIGERVAMFAVDSSGRPLGGRPVLGRLHTASPALRTHLMRYAPDGARISVVDRHGYLLARAGSIDDAPRGHLFRVADDYRPLAGLYRAILGRSEARDTLSGSPIGLWGAPLDAARDGTPSALWVEASSDDSALVRAAVPIAAESGLLGAVMVEQAGDRLLLVRDTALVRLFNLTLLATGIAVLSIVGFSAWLARRLRRLSRAAAGAMTPEGRIEVQIPETGSTDEVGELARSFRTLLSRLTEHTEYLRTLGSKLSHELRTPLAVVSSSLDNLQNETLTGEAPVYLNRARDGTNRLHRLLTALSEASRVEQSIEQAERVRFDLGELLQSAAAGYAQTCGDARLRVSLPSEPCPMHGAPELIAQML